MIRTEVLHVFVTVAASGNIRDAADQLCRTQSAISMSLKQLETHLGAPLFESDRKHSLTDLGRFVQSVAVVLLRDHDTATRLIEGYTKGDYGQLRISLADSPKAEVYLVDTDSADVRHLVETGQADLGLASAPVQDGLIDTPLFEDDLKLVCRSDSILAQTARPLLWADIEGVPIILNETSRGIQAADFLALAATARLRVRNVTSLLAMVQAGVGVTLFPGLATRSLPVPLVALPLADPTCRRTVGVLHRAGRVQSPLALAFQQQLFRVIGPLATRFDLTPARSGRS